MTRHYQKEIEDCPFYEFIEDREFRRVFAACNHPDEDIGYYRKTKVRTAIGRKCCNHGKYKTEFSDHVCRIILEFFERGSVQVQLKLGVSENARCKRI